MHRPVLLKVSEQNVTGKTQTGVLLNITSCWSLCARIKSKDPLIPCLEDLEKQTSKTARCTARSGKHFKTCKLSRKKYHLRDPPAASDCWESTCPVASSFLPAEGRIVESPTCVMTMVMRDPINMTNLDFLS